MKSLDLRNFKKVSSDGKTTTFRKDGGHEIKIAHSALSKDLQKQITALPGYDDGGEVSEDREPTSAATPEDADAEQENFDEANPSHSLDQDSVDRLHMSKEEMSTINNIPPTPQNQQDLSSVPIDQTAQPGLPSPAVSNPNLFSAGAQEEMSNLKQGMQGYNEATQQEANKISQNSDAIASDALTHQMALSKFNDASTAAQNDINQRRQANIQDINNQHIDPSHYYESLSSGQKAMTAIGLILGGIGGMGHQNMALDFLNKQIDRDVEAQKANLGKKETLLSANFKEAGDLRDAEAMTRVNMADIYTNQLQQRAVQLQGPMAQARAQQAASQLQMKVAPELGQLTQKVAMGKMLQSMQSQNMSPESKIQMYQMSGIMPQQEASKAMEELKSSQENENVKNNILSAAQKIAGEQTLGNRVMNPLQSSQQIANLNTEIHVQAAKQLGARYTPQVAKEMDDLTAGLTSGKTTVNQMQATLNNIFGQKEVTPYLNKWGLNSNKPQAFNSQGKSNFTLGNVK